MLGIGTVIEGGFRLLREQPIPLLIWGAIYGVLNLVMLLVMRPLFAAQATMGVPGQPPDPAAMMNMLGPIYGFQLLLAVALLVLWTAGLRSVMRPQDSQAAFLRLGMDELRILALTVMMVVFYFVAELIGVLAIVAATFGLVAAGSRGAAVALGAILGLLLLAMMVWATVRLSLCGPVTVYRRRIAIDEAWRLTKGRFWPLFGGYLVLLIVLAILLMILSTLTMGSYFVDLLRSAGDPMAVRQLAAAQAARWTGSSLTPIASALGGALTCAVSIGLGAGATGHAARALIDEEVDYAETFA